MGLSWRPQLPKGWRIVSVAGDGNPELQHGAILWTDQIPPSPIHMTYEVAVPLWVLNTQHVQGAVEYYLAGDINATSTNPTPETLSLGTLDTDGDGMPNGWEDRYGGGATNLAPFADDDGDGMVNLHECIAGTIPTNRESVLAFGGLSLQTNGVVVVRWQSATNRVYVLGRSTNLMAGFPVAVSNILATPPTNVCEDVVGEEKAIFYRVRIQESD